MSRWDWIARMASARSSSRRDIMQTPSARTLLGAGERGAGAALVVPASTRRGANSVQGGRRDVLLSDDVAVRCAGEHRELVVGEMLKRPAEPVARFGTVECCVM